MKKYSVPLLTESFSGKFAAPALLVAGLAKGATVGVAAVLGAMTAKKLLGDIVDAGIPALEPCID